MLRDGLKVDSLSGISGMQAASWVRRGELIRQPPSPPPEPGPERGDFRNRPDDPLGRLEHAAAMTIFLLQHEHEPDDCATAFAAWTGFDSPLRHKAAASTCLAGGHAVGGVSAPPIEPRRLRSCRATWPRAP